LGFWRRARGVGLGACRACSFFVACGVGATDGLDGGGGVGVGVGVRSGVGVGEWVVFNAITFLSFSGGGGGGVVIDVGAS
jgi:hypothetical protein